MKKKITVVILIICSVLFSACQTDQKAESPYTDSIYVTDVEKEKWRNALVKLLSNQKGYDFEIPRPEDPYIEYGYSMGLFDINMDGIPELLVDLGGGSLENLYFYVYDIMTGEHIAQIDGGADMKWNVYYDIENERYRPIGRYTWRDGSWGSMNFLTTISYDEENKNYIEKELFYSECLYRNVLDYDSSTTEPHLADVKFLAEGKPCGSQEYQHRIEKFYEQNSLVPYTGLQLYRWDDVSDKEDDDLKRAEKMAQMLLFDSGQKFIKIK